MPNYLMPEGGRKAADDLLRRYREWKAEYTGKKMVNTPFGPAEQQPSLLRSAAVGAGEFLLGGEPGSVDSARANLLGFAMPVAYHGTPNYFTKFDSSKIGIGGEGAQSFGHGLYFSENQAVAKEYQNTLSHGIKGGGYMYKVDIPESTVSKMLDWDKPLNQQSPEVQKALKEAIDDIKQEAYDRALASTSRARQDVLWNMVKNPEIATGEFLYHGLLRSKGGSVKASKFLEDLGIPGIRYLDQGSRATGKGTNNYVVFSDKDVKILERR